MFAADAPNILLCLDPIAAVHTGNELEYTVKPQSLASFLAHCALMGILVRMKQAEILPAATYSHLL